MRDFAIPCNFAFHNNIKMIRPDLKICWFAVTRPCLQGTGGSKKISSCSFLKKKFNHKYIVLAMLTLESKVNFCSFFCITFQLFVLFLLFLPSVLCASFTRLRYTNVQVCSVYVLQRCVKREWFFDKNPLSWVWKSTAA